MRIDLLYFDGCPSWQSALDNLKAALEREGVIPEIRLLHVEDDAQAAILKFLGSPSFQVKSQDWWPEARTTYDLSCRVYPTPAGIRGTPSVEMLQEKLHAAQDRVTSSHK